MIKSLPLFIVLLSAVFFSGCDKPDDLGQDLIIDNNNNLNILFTDTLTIEAHSVLIDSVLSSNLKQNLLGSYYDDVFGTTTAGFYTQLRLSENNPSFGNNPVVDSVILSLDYQGFYGDTASVHTFRVWECDSELYPDSTYFSNDSESLKPGELCIQTEAFKPDDSVWYGDIQVEPYLRLYLDKSWGEKIVAKEGQSELSDNDHFQQFVKGLYVTVDKTVNRGGFAYFDLMSPLSIVTIFYHNDEDTLTYKFAINQYCAYYSHFDHYGYADASPDFVAQTIHGDTMLGDQTLYIQSMGGVKTSLRFPYLDELTKDGSIAVNNAELIISTATGSTANDEPNAGLALVRLDSLGKQQFVPDYYEGSTYYGGDYISSDKQYRFNINRYMNNLISGKDRQYGTFILTKGASVYGNRLVFNGPKANDRKLRLKLTYTRVNN